MKEEKFTLRTLSIFVETESASFGEHGELKNQSFQLG
jgi:hypothetical protein